MVLCHLPPVPAKRFRVPLWEVALNYGVVLALIVIALIVSFGVVSWWWVVPGFVIVFGGWAAVSMRIAYRRARQLQPGEWLEPVYPRWVPGDRGLSLALVATFMIMCIGLIIATIAIATRD